MGDQEVIHNNWFQRIFQSIKGIPLGLFYIAVACYVLVYGEKKHALTTEVLKVTSLKVVNPDSSNYNPLIKNQLVIVYDSIKPPKKNLSDKLTNVSGGYTKLYRQVKVYQWNETIDKKSHRDNKGGKTDSITYTYSKVWDEELIIDSIFHNRKDHKNPSKKPLESKEFTSNKITFGKYKLADNLVSELNKYEPLSLSSVSEIDNKYTIAQDTFRCLGKETSSDGAIYSKRQINGSYLFQGKGNAQSPKIGDLKLVYWVIQPSDYTIIAQEKNKVLSAFELQDGFVISELNCGTNFNYDANGFAIIKSGENSIKQMYEWAHDRNDFLFVIGLRLVGFLFMISGFKKLFLPIAILPAWIPYIGNYSGKVILKFSFLIATSLAFLISGTTWLIYNKFENISFWDYYFLFLLFLIFIGGIRVKASVGEHHVDSSDIFET
jgi:hypothetical protein